MKDLTKEKILALIREKEPIQPKDIVESLGLNFTGIFRHLRDLVEQGLVYKVGKPPRVCYYLYTQSMLNFNSKILPTILRFTQSGDLKSIEENQLCATRDVFQARSSRLLPLLQSELKNDKLSYLLLAMIDEIGNNSFDHNLGNWKDVMGAVLAVDFPHRIIILSDRGQGILKTIFRVRPDIVDNMKALQVVFTEIVSGRAPEQRGNGLKFVRKVTIENNLMLKYFSGDATCTIAQGQMEIKKNDFLIPGMLAVIKY